jgi:hypothetical protein
VISTREILPCKIASNWLPEPSVHHPQLEAPPSCKNLRYKLGSMFAVQQRLTAGISAFMEQLKQQLELIISGVTTSLWLD